MARGFNYAAGASDDVQAASSADLDKATLQTMGQSKNAYVREIIAGRLDCPLGLMVTLAHDYVPDVRIAVAGNASALQSVMEYLARDKHAEVLAALVANPKLPRHVVADLAAHKRREIREPALRRLGAMEALSPDAADHATPELRDRAFDDAHPATPPVEPFMAEATRMRAPAPTRTAPVRGFRVPEQA